MNYKDILDIDISNLSNLDETTRQNIIKTGYSVYITSIQDTSNLLDIDFNQLLLSSILITEQEIEKQTLQENYELCYFLKKIIEKIKEEHYGL
jgi:predicted transcriptional regulator